MYVTNLYNHRFFHHTLVMWPAAVSPFRTGKHPLVYQPPPCYRFVQENTLWCTNLRLAAVSYRKTPSGVPTSALLPFRTGRHPLVYQPPPCCRFVQQNTLRSTPLLLSADSSTTAPSTLPPPASLPFRTGKHPLVYQPPP